MRSIGGLRLHLTSLLDHLDRKARAMPAEKDRSPRRRAAILLSVAVVFVAIFRLAASTGLNEEMTAPVYLHPYQYLADESLNADARAGACVDGYFVQPARPIFGFCAGEQRIPLLFNAYTSAVSYWPLWLIGNLFDDYRLLVSRIIPGIFLLALLILMAVQATRHGEPRLGTLSVLLLLVFPLSSIYATLYLYEYLSLVSLLSVWWLVDRYNRTGQSWPFLAAALLVGYAVQQKLTAGLVLPAFLGCWLGFYGLRRPTTKLWVGGAAMALIFPAIFLVIRALHFGVSGKFQELGMASEPVPWLEMVVLLARWALTGLPHEEGAWSTAGRLLFFLLLVGYSGFRVVRYVRSGVGDRFVAFASLALLVILAGFFLIYRYHPTSLPTLQFLPVVCFVIAAMVVDGLRGIERRLPLRWLTTGVVGVAILATAFLRSSAYYGVASSVLGYPTLAEQERVVQRLLDERVSAPWMLNSYKNGVFEFLSQGQIRPLYLTAEACTPLDADAWRRILEAARGRPVDFIFSQPPARLDPVVRCNPEALSRFEAALDDSEQSVSRRLELPIAGDHRRLLLLTVE